MHFSLLRRITVVLACLCLAACGKKPDPYFFLNPQIPVSQPFSIAKAGNKISMDFWIVPKELDKTRLGYWIFPQVDQLKQVYEVGLTFHFNEKTDPRNQIRDQYLKIPIKAQLFYINNSVQTPVDVDSCDRCWASANMSDGHGGWIESDRDLIHSKGGKAPNEKKIKNIAYLHQGGYWGWEQDMEIVTFEYPHYGHYRVELETIQDQPLFNNLTSEITVGVAHSAK